MARISSTSNPTNLKEVARKDVGLSRLELSGQKCVRVDRLDLGDYGLAGDERVSLVARAGPTSQRYDIGTVQAWTKAPLELTELDLSQVLRFRIVVRKEGSARWIATAENLRCKGEGEIESLLPIVSTDLGQRLWRMVIDEDGAVLQCNEQVFPSGASAEGFVPFRALVLPEALRQVLEYVAKDPEKLDAEGTVWAEWGQWMRHLGVEVPPPSEEEQLQVWLVESTARFCDEFKSAQDLQDFLHRGEVA